MAPQKYEKAAECLQQEWGQAIGHLLSYTTVNARVIKTGLRVKRIVKAPKLTSRISPTVGPESPEPSTSRMVKSSTKYLVLPYQGVQVMD